MKQILLILIAMTALYACAGGGSEEPAAVDLEQIRERGYLRVITAPDPVGYFIYRGEPMGYDLELIERFGEHLGLPVEIVSAADIAQMTEMLEAGEGDLIAHRLTVNGRRREQLQVSRPLYFTRPVLVQRKPAGWRDLTPRQLEARLLRSPVSLDGIRVHVGNGSVYSERLANLAQEAGIEIEVVEAEEEVSNRQLVAGVADGSFDFAVVDEEIAVLEAGLHPVLDVKTPVGLSQQVSWGLRHDTPDLLGAIDAWLDAAQSGADHVALRRKYLHDVSGYRRRVASDLFPLQTGTISPYDDLFRRYARRLDWDWRMLAALAYQESRFDPRARSWMGAMGLMQLMPATARHFGARNVYDPHDNLRAATSFLVWLQYYWAERIIDPEERLRFVIASYNVGQGHVEDARRLAMLYESDPDVWHGNVDHYLLAKANPEYYNNDVVQFGFARGSEPVNFVNRVYALTTHYRNFAE